MRLAGRPSLLIGTLVILLACFALAGCENPFDPVSRTPKIQGLSFVDFSLTWDRWDSDPEFDGSAIQMDYRNQFNESLSFHDKPHTITIEFWTQKETSSPTDETILIKTPEKLIFTTDVEFSNSDDVIRIPIEDYRAALVTAGFDLDDPGGAIVAVILRVHPPEAFPQESLVAVQPDQTVFKPEVIVLPTP